MRGESRYLLEQRTRQVQYGRFLINLHDPVSTAGFINELQELVQGVSSDAFLSYHGSHRHTSLDVNSCEYGGSSTCLFSSVREAVAHLDDRHLVHHGT